MSPEQERRSQGVFKLIDAICDAYSMALPGEKWAPRMIDGVLYTYCNEAVNFICKRMNYTKFDRPLVTSGDEAILANQMFDKMSEPEGDWMAVFADVAQYHANQGAIVIAGMKNKLGHGHVCIVRPGILQHSGKWQAPAPRVMNVGRDVFIDRKASFAFREQPSYFVLKEMVA
jgi:hypothetical protein